jgi:hypothetical protein
VNPKSIAIWYHVCTSLNREHALEIMESQSLALVESGVATAASQILVGANSVTGDLPEIYARLPGRSIVWTHPESDWPMGEGPTIRLLQEWSKAFPECYVLYLHTKGLSADRNSPQYESSYKWRMQMMSACVWRWRECVHQLGKGMESVGQRWDDATNGSYWAGNFWWATSAFLNTLPAVGWGSRFDAETWIGTGPQLPKRKVIR